MTYPAAGQGCMRSPTRTRQGMGHRRLPHRPVEPDGAQPGQHRGRTRAQGRTRTKSRRPSPNSPCGGRRTAVSYRAGRMRSGRSLPAVIPGLVADRAVRAPRSWAAAGPAASVHTRPAATVSQRAGAARSPGPGRTRASIGGREGETGIARPRRPWHESRGVFATRVHVTVTNAPGAGWTRRAQAAGVSSAQPNSREHGEPSCSEHQDLDAGVGRRSGRGRQRRSGLRLSGGGGSRAHRQDWAVSARGSLCPADR